MSSVDLTRNNSTRPHASTTYHCVPETLAVTDGSHPRENQHPHYTGKTQRGPREGGHLPRVTQRVAKPRLEPKSLVEDISIFLFF